MSLRSLRPPRLFLIVSLIAFAAGARAFTAVSPETRTVDAANDSWERGDYIAALNGYVRALNGPGGDALLESIALTTGELFETRELTPDGRAARFSPDGQFLVYETGLETSRATRILRNGPATRSGQAPALVAELPGVSATFSPQLDQVAYLRIPDNEQIREASAAIQHASLTAENRDQLVRALTWLVAKQAVIVVRDLHSGREMELPTPDLVKTGLVFSADGRTLYFLGARESDPARTDVYAISESAPKPVIAADAGGLKSAPIVDPSGAVLIYVIPAQNPLRRPALPPQAPVRAGGAGRAGEAGGAGGAGQAGGASGSGEPNPAAQAGRGGARRAGAPPPRFGIVDMASGKVSIVDGSAPALSGDGKTLAYVARSGPDFSLMVGPPTGVQTAIKRTTQRLDAPALSADGARVAFQMMPRDDWEIFVASRDGSGERQVTREIQHDVLPRFIGSDRLLGVIGEPRHRRSYLYDLGSEWGRSGVGVGSESTPTPVRVQTVSQQYSSDDRS